MKHLTADDRAATSQAGVLVLAAFVGGWQLVVIAFMAMLVLGFALLLVRNWLEESE